MKKWRCKICGHIYEGDQPGACSRCHFGLQVWEIIEENGIS